MLFKLFKFAIFLITSLFVLVTAGPFVLLLMAIAAVVLGKTVDWFMQKSMNSKF